LIKNWLIIKPFRIIIVLVLVQLKKVRMKKIYTSLFVLALLLSSTVIMGQNKGSISGNVVDEESEGAIPFASISILINVLYLMMMVIL